MQVTIIGGGSYQWTPELMADLFGTESLRGMHLVLEDIDPAPLPKMEALANKLSAAMDAKATVATTTDQRRALDGADFVIVTISTGGFESMAFDLDVPVRYGIRQSVGDTVGPGGINRALAQHPGHGRHRQGRRVGVPRCLVPQHHQPHDGAHPHRHRGQQVQGGRALPRGG